MLGSNILFFVAHFDDAEINAAGSIARWVSEGRNVDILVATCLPDEKVRRVGESLRAAEVLGCEVSFLDFDSDSFSDIYPYVRVVDGMARGYDTVVSHRVEDSHQDHRACGRIAQSVVRRNDTNLLEMNHSIPGGLAAGDKPNMFVDITGYETLKAEALSQYADVAEWMPAIVSRDMYYGRVVGTSSAEGFIARHLVL